MGVTKTLRAAKRGALQAWKKLAQPTVTRGSTAWPKAPKDQEKFGVRFDYDGIITKNGTSYHKYQVQPNAGKIPTSISKWMEKNGKTTHAVMADVLVEEGATESDVEKAIDDAFDTIEI